VFISSAVRCLIISVITAQDLILYRRSIRTATPFHTPPIPNHSSVLRDRTQIARPNIQQNRPILESGSICSWTTIRGPEPSGWLAQNISARQNAFAKCCQIILAGTIKIIVNAAAEIPCVTVKSCHANESKKNLQLKSKNFELQLQSTEAGSFQ
jgi:hypothetical protein